ncbi:MAG: hypothetical protein L0387_16460 [Acidobacteria bacterium]|nr:hypothetical protein [Acidobacteriota bacterium]
MKDSHQSHQSNVGLAQSRWGTIPEIALIGLGELTKKYKLSVALGDLHYFDGRWYVTHSGLLRLARRERCVGIRVQVVSEFCDPDAGRWVCKATAFTSSNCRGFTGFGEADRADLPPELRGAAMRIAETRSVCRALRKAYGVGLCALEELGASVPPAKPPVKVTKTVPAPQSGSGNGNGQPRLRDRLCQLIRQHRLDPEQVKRYAADFCGTQALREASRELVEDFVKQLAEWAARDRAGLLCHLNRYAKAVEPAEPKEVAS